MVAAFPQTTAAVRELDNHGPNAVYPERKVKCDGAQPECNKCRIAGRICRAGHAFALSWPKPRSRRALEGPRSAQDQGHAAAAARQAGSGAQRYFFVNADADHIAAHYLLPYVGSSRGALQWALAVLGRGV